ncbi:MAG TPA: DsbA family protein [Bryobacteraceae bacterium]|jgi:protein-disulfide isomerase|nr:DsbA family protein [Bryobacteraceae bacterium]
MKIAAFLLSLARVAFSADPASLPSPKVAIEVFSDFQCPFCKQFAEPVRELEEKGVEGIGTSVEFRNFPLGFHANAQLAAQAAMAAAEQGKFWEMHDLLFANQAALQRDQLLGYARKLGLDMPRFIADLDSDRVKKIIEADRAEGAKRGVTGTPTLFINGKSYSGTRTFDQLKQLIQGEQRRSWSVAELTDNMLSRGPADAPVTVEFYADLVSPVTRPAAAVIDQLMARYPSDIRLQFRNFPLAFHPQAGLAHEAAMDAAREGRFWQFADFILEHQDSIGEADLVSFAGHIGLDQTVFAERLRQRRYTGRVEADLEEGTHRGLRGSPVIFVNTRRIDGVPSLETLTEYVEAELAAKRVKR